MCNGLVANVCGMVNQNNSGKKGEFESGRGRGGVKGILKMFAGRGGFF